MRFYRVYAIDLTDSIDDIRLIEAENDEGALAKARSEFGEQTAIEVWDQRRLVGQIVPDSEEMLPVFHAIDENALAT